jgi:hypothetical protein
MKYSLLEMVQSIMSDMDSDDIDTISDTEEAMQVVNIIKDVYFQMVSNSTIPEHEGLGRLESADTDSLVFMKIPDSVKRIEWLRYNKIQTGQTDDQWGEVVYLSPKEFVHIIMTRPSSDTTTVTVTDPDSGVTLDMIRNDTAPTYWTSFDDEYVCFDSYDSVVDPIGLVSSKTLCWVTNIPYWETDDDFIPDIDDNLFPVLLTEAKSTAFSVLKGQAVGKIERQARNQKIYASNDKYRTAQAQKASTNTPDYGRKR